MSIQWTGSRIEGQTEQRSLPRLINRYIYEEDSTITIFDILRLTELLILSSHFTEAHLIASTLYTLVRDFELTDNGKKRDFKIDTPSTLEVFWNVNQSVFPRPQRAPHSVRDDNHKMSLRQKQWSNYAQCTYSKWNVEFMDNESPSSVWRETDDPATLATCARLLAKTTTRYTYPPENLAREALEVAQKLYATPDIPKEAWAWKSNEPRRHAHLLYRRLPIELAIHLGDFLMVPGIFDVLPLLARGGKESNPFSIPKQDAVGMVREITAVLELRAKHGGHRELHPTKVGWSELLNRLAEGVWHLHHEEYQEMGIKNANDLLYEPATKEEITAAEKKVGELPADFKEMVRVANGFKSRPDFFEGGIPGIQDITIKEGDDGYLRYELGDYS
ncbi:uncharacterized protein N7518_000389 [Penicillium psychrosexuale]|uniref:uncharacterized protein n=1 Tax=Penicillium psychrosexuale TaxID=1002107 RepID=UPI00254548B2|nr:uncharacterized protein N7518_000389 [Penicillium psychrosexuale]KAJ5804086.1 hypothetical protein N7518_000389 [Penicillium psychrosexuale]